jgi:hypothetical protein
VITVSIGDTTQIERKNHKLPFYRHTDMDVTALLPGLTIEAEGVANSNGQLEASVRGAVRAQQEAVAQRDAEVSTRRAS